MGCRQEMKLQRRTSSSFLGKEIKTEGLALAVVELPTSKSTCGDKVLLQQGHTSFFKSFKIANTTYWWLGIQVYEPMGPFLFTTTIHNNLDLIKLLCKRPQDGSKCYGTLVYHLFLMFKKWGYGSCLDCFSFGFYNYFRKPYGLSYCTQRCLFGSE